MMAAIQSSSGWTVHLPAKPKLLQVGSDCGIELGSLLLLLPERRREPFHLLRERLVIFLGRCCADVAPRCEHVAVLADVIELRDLAEPGHVRVRAGPLVAAPCVIGARD